MCSQHYHVCVRPTKSALIVNSWTCVFVFQDSVRVWDRCSPDGFVWERVRKVGRHFAAVVIALKRMMHGNTRKTPPRPHKGLVLKEDEGGVGIVLFRSGGTTEWGWDKRKHEQQQKNNNNIFTRWIEYVTHLPHLTPPPSPLGHSQDPTGHNIIHISTPPAFFLLAALRHPQAAVTCLERPWAFKSVPRMTHQSDMLLGQTQCPLWWSSAQMTSADECDMSRLEDGGAVTLQLQHNTSWYLLFGYLLPIFTQGCVNVNLSFYSSALESPLSSVPGWCLCPDVLCDNPGNSCGNSPIATVLFVTPQLKSAQVNVNRKSLII